MRMVRIGEASKMLGLTPQTVRKYAKNGSLKSYNTPSGQYLFDSEDINQFLGKTPEQSTPEQKTVFYVRSSNGQDASIKTQIKILTEHYGTPQKIYQDKASGLKDNRKNLMKMIKDAQKGEFTNIAITHKDRLTRFGYNYLQELFTQNNITITHLNSDQDTTLHEELMKDFMSLIASFSGKFYRLRGYEQQKQLIKTAETEIDQKQEGQKQ